VHAGTLVGSRLVERISLTARFVSLALLNRVWQRKVHDWPDPSSGSDDLATDTGLITHPAAIE
jgi:hypothetical protein